MESDRDLIVVENGDVFFGLRLQFADRFFSNANNKAIEDWCKSNGWELEILPKGYKVKPMDRSIEGWEERRNIGLKAIDEFLNEMNED